MHFSLFAAACSDTGRQTDTSVRGDSTVWATDDVGRRVELDRPATRVVSLLPAATETVAALGVPERVVGRTRYDTEEWLARVPEVGGGLDPNLEAIVALRPQLVVAWESPTGSKVRERLESMGIAVYAAATRDTAAIYRTIAGLGRLLGRVPAADSLAGSIRAELDSVRATVPPGPRPSVLYVVGADPPMIAGLDNFIAELIGVAGGEPLAIAGDRKGLSPQVSLEELIRRQPDIVILPVGEDPTVDLERLRRSPGWRDLAAIRDGRAAEVEALLVNRPGPSIGEMARVLRRIIREHAPPR